jgi:hypothetical protein
MLTPGDQMSTHDPLLEKEACGNDGNHRVTSHARVVVIQLRS